MKSAFLLSTDKELFAHTYGILASLPGWVSALSMLQLIDDRGHVFNLWDVPADDPDFEFDLRQPIDGWWGEGIPPNPAELTACYVECRWEDMFIHWVEYIADRLGAPLWVWDSSGALWPAKGIDPHELLL